MDSGVKESAGLPGQLGSCSDGCTLPHLVQGSQHRVGEYRQGGIVQQAGGRGQRGDEGGGREGGPPHEAGQSQLLHGLMETAQGQTL